METILHCRDNLSFLKIILKWLAIRLGLPELISLNNTVPIILYMLPHDCPTYILVARNYLDIFFAYLWPNQSQSMYLVLLNFKDML